VSRRYSSADDDDDDDGDDYGVDDDIPITTDAASKAAAVAPSKVQSIPADLIAALQSGHAMLYAGADIREIVVAPTLAELLNRLLTRLNPTPSPKERSSLDVAIGSGKLDYPAEFITRRIGERERLQPHVL
jgi:hypothetical protein